MLSAVEAANKAQKDCGLRPAPERGQFVRDIADVLTDHREELAGLIMSEQGKPREQAIGEVSAAADMSNYMTE